MRDTIRTDVLRLATLLVAFVAAFSAPGVVARAEPADDPVVVEYLPDESIQCLPGLGYTELVFRVENLTDETHEVEIRLGAAAMTFDRDFGATATTTVGPRATVRVVVPVPSFAIDGSYSPSTTAFADRRELEALGYSLSSPLGVNSTPFDSALVHVFSDRGLGAGWPQARAAELSNVAIDSLPADVVEAFDLPSPSSYENALDWRAGRGGSSTSPFATFSGLPRASGTYVVEERATSAMPTSARAYTGGDVVVLDGGPVDPGRLAELARWVRLGGTCVLARCDSFASFGDLDEAFREDAVVRQFDDARVAQLGLGHVVRTAAPPLESKGQRYAIWWLMKRSPSFIVPTTEHAYTGAYSGMPSSPSQATLRWRPALPELEGVGEVSHRVLVVAMAILALVMGPLTIVLVRRSGRPVALLLLIPLLSLAGTASVVTFGILHNGLGVVDAVKSWAVLDQGAQIASSMTLRTVFMGSSGGRRLLPGSGTFVVPILDTGRSGPRRDEPFTIDGDADRGVLAYSSNFLPVRRPFAHAVYTDRSSRRRLDVERDASGAVTVVDELGVDVLQLWLRDREGRLWRHTGRIAGGGRAVLEEVRDGESELATFLFQVAPGPHMPGFDRLAPGSYVARLSAPIVEDDCGFGGRRVSQSQILVGVLEKEALR